MYSSSLWMIKGPLLPISKRIIRPDVKTKKPNYRCSMSTRIHLRRVLIYVFSVSLIFKLPKVHTWKFYITNHQEYTGILELSTHFRLVIKFWAVWVYQAQLKLHYFSWNYWNSIHHQSQHRWALPAHMPHPVCQIAEFSLTQSKLTKGRPINVWHKKLIKNLAIIIQSLSEILHCGMPIVAVHNIPPDGQCG